MASSSGSRLDRQLVRVARRDQLAVVGELALDQPGRQPRAADFERRVAIAESHRELFAAADQSLQLVERSRRARAPSGPAPSTS